MKTPIIELLEIGEPKSIIHREGQPITELIDTGDLVKELNQQLRLYFVVGRSEQLKAFADYAQKRMWEDGGKDLSEFVEEFLRL